MDTKHNNKFISLPSVFLFVVIQILSTNRVNAIESPDPALYDITKLPQVTIITPKNPSTPLFQVPNSTFTPLPQKQSLTKEKISSLADGSQFVSDQIIVKYKKGTTKRQKDLFRLERNLATVPSFIDKLNNIDAETMQLTDVLDLASFQTLKQQYEQNQIVDYVELNFVASVQFTPNDPQFPQQWNLFRINAPQAWDMARGDKGATVAVLDTGLNTADPDAPITILAGYDFANNDFYPTDDNGHGSFIAKIIAGNTDNNIEMAGICHFCSVLPVKVLNAQGIGTYADLAAGIVYAVDNGASVINISVGGYGFSQILLEGLSPNTPTYPQENK